MKADKRGYILVKIITILYYDNKTKEKIDNVLLEVRNFLDQVKIEGRDDSKLGGEFDAIMAMKVTAEWMIHVTRDVEFTVENICQRIHANTRGECFFLDHLKSYLNPNLDKETCRARVSEIFSELRFETRYQNLKDFVHKASNKLSFSSEYQDPGAWAREMIAELEPYTDSSGDSLPGFIGGVDFTDEAALEDIISKAVTESAGAGRLKTGFTGWDLALGGGYKRGDLINHGALTHNYKSGKMLDDCLFIPAHNEPNMIDENKKPLINRISFENTQEQDILVIYKRLHAIKYGEHVDLAEVNTMKAAKEISNWFGEKGYYFRLDCFNPQNFSIYDLQAYYNNLEKNGYEIHLSAVDYLAQIAHNTQGDRLDAKIQRTLDMARMFAFPRSMTLVSGHQLSTKAREVALLNPRHVPREAIAGAMYWETKSLSTKLDVEFVHHIVEGDDGGSYLMVERGKCRGGEDVPKSHRRFIYKFDPVAGLMCDYDRPELLLRNMPSVDLDDIANFE